MLGTLKIGGSLVVGVIVLALLTLRLVGFAPQYLDPRSEEFERANRIARPGLWLTGEVVREAVTDGDFVNHLDDPERRDTVMLETRTWYGIPHSVTIGIVGRGDKLYIRGNSSGRRMQTPFPNDKSWTQNASRDPRVRLKIEDKIYKATVALTTDRDEVAGVMGWNPVTVERGPDGQERVTAVMHHWRVFRRNVPDNSAESQGWRSDVGERSLFYWSHFMPIGQVPSATCEDRYDHSHDAPVTMARVK